MHDDALERRLQDALRAEADELPFTITAAELEQRVALRGRVPGNRRGTMLLAAAVAIGALGVAGLAGGLFDDNRPAPTVPVTAAESSVPGSPSVPASTPGPSAPDGPVLPSLDELIAIDRVGVLVAQASGPSDGSTDALWEFPGPTGYSIGLGTFAVSGEYSISVACLGTTDITLDIREPFSRGPLTGPIVRCDGSTVEEQVIRRNGAAVSLSTPGPVSWRIVVRTDVGISSLPPVDPVLPPAEAGLEELIRLDDQVLESIHTWGDAGMVVRDYGTAPRRASYEARLWCPAGRSVRLILGLETGMVPTAETETHLACDGTVQHLHFDRLSPRTTPVFVAATFGTRFSLLMTSEAPVATVRDLPGWQLAADMEPQLSVGPGRTTFGIPVDGGGPLQVVIACAGAESIEVNIDTGARVVAETFPPAEPRPTDSFVAPCSDQGATVSHIFEAPSYEHALVFYDTEPGTWSAMSIFIPESTP